MNRLFRNSIFYIILILVAIGILASLMGDGQRPETVSYHEFLEFVEEGYVEELQLQADNQATAWMVTGLLREDVAEQVFEEAEQTQFQTQVPFPSAHIFNVIDNNPQIEVEFASAPGDPIWYRLLFFMVPLALILILFFFLMSQAQGGGNKVMNFGKSKAKMVQDDKKKVTFKDVAGADEEKEELIEVVDFLKDPRKFTQVGARIPKGVLLVGPPGTGKTLLGRAVAGEAGVPFFSISGSDFVEMFVGVGASRVRDLFENAKKNAPCIIFIDEIDAVGRQRGAGLGGGHDEREQTLNQLLVEMDGFAVNEGIIIMAATNRPDVLDPALLRPGRFDRQITVDKPDLQGREAVLHVHARNKPLADDVKMGVIARRTPGFSGADLENLLNESALLAARRNKTQISMEEVDDAIDRVIAGTEKRSRKVAEKERQIVAYHESGHTIVGVFLKDADAIHKVTIVPRGNAGGYAVPLPKEERFMMTEQELKDRIVGLLGGRVAEEIVLGEVSTGASNDFQRATGIARRMVMEFGMSKLGPLQFGESQGQVFLGRDLGNERNYSENIAYEIDQEVQRIINEQYDRCRELITEHRQELELIAKTLLDIETLTADQIMELVEKGRLEEHAPAQLADRNSTTANTSDDSGTRNDDSHSDESSPVNVNIQSKKDDPQSERSSIDSDEESSATDRSDTDNKKSD